MPNAEGHRLDPADMGAFGAAFHDLLDACLARMGGARDLPWIAPPADMDKTVGLALDQSSTEIFDLFGQLTQNIMPYATGNTHPRFFGWVHGSGLPQAAAAELVAATMNANMGGRHQGGVAVEQAVIDWTRQVAGLPDTASGILTSGTSQATILALQTALVRAFPDVRTTGIRALPAIRVYAATGSHSCVKKALEVMGHGARALRLVPVTDAGQMDLAALGVMVADDHRAGHHPLAVVGTAGSVNLGIFDPIRALADFCAAQNLWLHIDGAFGFWTRLAAAPWRDLSNGVDRADSIAADFHKWIGAPYDCGICLIRDRGAHLAAFRERPDYLKPGDGLAGGDQWFCDYGLELSRGFRALKVWTTIKACGAAALGAAITDNCRQAALMADLVNASDVLTLAHPVVSNLCTFYPARGDADTIAATLQLSGAAVFSTTMVGGRSCLRAAIVNHRTTAADIRAAIAAVEQAVRPA